MSDFIESVDDMIARDFSFEALREFQDTSACEIKDWAAAEKLMYQLIRSSIAHARSQLGGRKAGMMTFDEAMKLVRTQNAMVTRPRWHILRAVRRGIAEYKGTFSDMKLDNHDGGTSGSGRPYEPTDEDRAATDWMIYQSPEENWVELTF